MTVTIDVPEDLVAAIQARGQSVQQYLLQAAEDAVELRAPDSTVSERQGLVDQMLAEAKGRLLRQSIRSAIDEGRRY